MKASIFCAAALALPLVSALPAPTAAPGNLDIIKYGRDALDERGLLPRQLPTLNVPPDDLQPSSAKSQPSSSSTTSPPPSTTVSSTSSTTSTSTTSQPTPTSTTSLATDSSKPPVVHSSTSQTKIESTQSDGLVITITSEVVVTSEGPSASPTTSSPPENSGGNQGIPTSTIVGLSVAGGLAALVAIAFIVWKLTSKRFSQFDNDDGINWPDLQKDPEVVAPRPATSIAAASTTASTVELVAKDPYAVPPIPQNNGTFGPYRDDTASGYYDPYRGPVPQTFATPPASTDGHQQGWTGGEAIPMSTYASGRASPGPNLAYGDPYANAGYMADPMQRTGTPVQRIATPVQRMATPAGGGSTFQEIARAGTPGGGAVPYRTGTPGYGYGGR